MNDDIFYPQKIAQMVEIYRNNPDVSIVTSMRHNIDETGKVIGHMHLLSDKSEKLDGKSIGKFIVMYTGNDIGEPTTVLIRKKFLRNNDLCWTEDEKGFFSVVDYSTWLQLLSKGDIYWINEPLSARRVHANQGTMQIDIWMQFYINFAKEVATAWNRKIFLETEEELRKTIIHWLPKAANALQRGLLENYNGKEMKIMPKVITLMTQALYNGYNLKWSKIR